MADSKEKDFANFTQLVRGRRMTRSFTRDQVDADLVDALVGLARLAPRAGNTQGIEFLVLESSQVDDYWNTTFNEKNRDDFPWPNLFNVPVLILIWVDPKRYVERYSEGDKRRSGLGKGTSAWQTPYWWVDGGMAAMTILMGAESRGLSALFFGLFDHEQNVKAKFGVPQRFKSIGAIALGYATDEQRRSKSLDRPKRELDEVLHRGRWSS
ncbi:MAG TPA: hypothetical protein DCY30_08800 [Acidimicrobiaceae bacterium]|nr:hypothetical protein [Acidimicrobiaceae bacterium]